MMVHCVFDIFVPPYALLGNAISVCVFNSLAGAPAFLVFMISCQYFVALKCEDHGKHGNLIIHTSKSACFSSERTKAFVSTEFLLTFELAHSNEIQFSPCNF